MSITDAIAHGNVALCGDNTYSDNTKFRATCSSHHGVAQWLATYGQCGDGKIITMKADASCDGHNGFAALMPANYQPPTTTLPPTTTTIAPAENDPCDKPQERKAGLVCAPTVTTPVWINAPFSSSKDQVALLGDTAKTSNGLQAGHMAILAGGFQQFKSYGQTYWCISVGLKNYDSSETPYNLFDFELLTPTGSLQPPTIPLVNDLTNVLQSGSLAPQGSVTGIVCFDMPRNRTGRLALVYTATGLLTDHRAMYYFDK